MTSAEIARAVGLGYLVLLGTGGVWILRDKDALRYDGTGLPKPYSFSRVQLWFWTLVILGCHAGVYARSGTFWQFNETCLTLLGISALTTTAGRVVDNRDKLEAGATNVGDAPSRGFLFDILSDERGLSVHRFQAALFNLLYGASFVVDVLAKRDAEGFPEYSSTTLLVLGLSSTTYIALKMNESAAPPAPPPVSK